MGLRNFSMESARILPLKEFMLAAESSAAERLVRRIRRSHTIEEIRARIFDYFSSNPALSAGLTASQILSAHPWPGSETDAVKPA